MKFDDHPEWDDLDHQFAAVRRENRKSARGRLAALLVFIDDISDDRLCQVGVEFIEELVDDHWTEIEPDLEAALPVHAGLRKALSCCWFNDDAVGEHLRAFIGPDEHIGKQRSEQQPKPVWENLRRAPIRDVRLPALVAMFDHATQAGLANDVEITRVQEVADPGAGHLLWPRYRCKPADPATAPFYRCAVLLGWSVAVFEADFVVGDIDQLPETEPWRIAALFKSASEGLPGIHELSPSWMRGDPRDKRLPDS